MYKPKFSCFVQYKIDFFFLVIITVNGIKFQFFFFPSHLILAVFLMNLSIPDLVAQCSINFALVYTRENVKLHEMEKEKKLRGFSYT